MLPILNERWYWMINNLIIHFIAGFTRIHQHPWVAGSRWLSSHFQPLIQANAFPMIELQPNITLENILSFAKDKQDRVSNRRQIFSNEHSSRLACLIGSEIIFQFFRMEYNHKTFSFNLVMWRLLVCYCSLKLFQENLLNNIKSYLWSSLLSSILFLCCPLKYMQEYLDQK